MKYNHLWLSAMLMFAFIGASQADVIIPEAKASTPAKQLWTCGMHPQVILDHPGNCPICEMKLTPLQNNTVNQGDNAVIVSPAAIQNMGLRTAMVKTGPARREIRTVGNVALDETALADVTTKVKGWIEKLYVDYTGQLVHRNDPLFEIYSPELYNAQIEYLLVRSQTAAGRNDPLADSTLKKLQFLDISADQIAKLEKSGQAGKTLAILAPRDGIVIEKNVVVGQMVEAGAKLYRIADLATVWVIVQVYERDLPFIKLGQEAEITTAYLPDRHYHGRVAYIYPTVDENTRTVKVRLEFHNPGYTLKPGMYVTAKLRSELTPSGLLVPDTAILRSGEKNTVFIALPGGKFIPREITLGPQLENHMYLVTSGLKEGEKIVTSGQFLLDSESQLHAALQRLTPDNNINNTGASQQGAFAATAQSSTYVCPMPEHASISYKSPGDCPLCHMKLVPADSSSPIQPQIDYYTCSMPEHANVHSDKPGKCPKCGMTLIPVYKKPDIEVKKAPVYICPMDPEIRSDKPANCPKCGMKLELEKK